ncbi:hypothetical protein ANO11243_014060 [Dothideomycetidae sp. 11243]|nr:hypothetical protein ANO11243_014060 [fungal sp. No.11243]
MRALPFRQMRRGGGRTSSSPTSKRNVCACRSHPAARCCECGGQRRLGKGWARRWIPGNPSWDAPTDGMSKEGSSVMDRATGGRTIGTKMDVGTCSAAAAASTHHIAPSTQ